MRHLFSSWFFFTCVLLFLVAAALVLPTLKPAILGETEDKLTAVTEELQQEAQAVWRQLTP